MVAAQKGQVAFPTISIVFRAQIPDLAFSGPKELVKVLNILFCSTFTLTFYEIIKS